LKIYVITLALTAVAWTIVGIGGVMLHEPYPPQHSLLRS
jgi:hypothetical protein